MKSWFRKLVERNREVWHYSCINSHKWESLKSPRGTHTYGESGQTRCPKCGSPLIWGEVYINGKFANMGACHIDFCKEKQK